MYYQPTLLESRRPVASGGAVGGGALSFVIHTSVIVAAVYATLATTRAAVERHLVVNVPLLHEDAPPPPPEVPRLATPPVGFSTLQIPTTTLTEIPPPSSAPFDATSFSGIGVESGRSWGQGADTMAHRVARANAVYAVEVVEELPVRLGGDTPKYPELLRNAGIAGEVMLEFVIDTAGRVEMGSARVVSSTHQLFNAPALAVLGSWRFRPARIGGMPVRARVHFPLHFRR